MKLMKWLGFGGYIILLYTGCQKECDCSYTVLYPENARLKRVLLYATVDSKEPLSIVEEYEYDE